MELDILMLAAMTFVAVLASTVTTYVLSRYYRKEVQNTAKQCMKGPAATAWRKNLIVFGLMMLVVLGMVLAFAVFILNMLGALLGAEQHGELAMLLAGAATNLVSAIAGACVGYYLGCQQALTQPDPEPAPEPAIPLSRVQQLKE